MSKSKTTNIVRMDWLFNRTPTGKRSATKARKLAQYFALGRGREKEQALRPQRGQWLDQDGRQCTHEEVLQWVRQQGMANLLTHQFILSVKETQLTAEAFNRAMAAGGELFTDWRLIQHEDTRYPHAHALAFGQKEVHIKSEAFQSWWRAVRQGLEREQAAAQALQYEQRLEQERAAVLQQDAGLVQEVAAGQQPRSNQVQQGIEGMQQQRDLVQDGAAREQAAQLSEQLEAEQVETALERSPNWGLEL